MPFWTRSSNKSKEIQAQQWNYPHHDPVHRFKPCETTDSLTRIWCTVHKEAVRTCDLRTCDTNHNALCHKCCSEQKVLV